MTNSPAIIAAATQAVQNDPYRVRLTNSGKPKTTVPHPCAGEGCGKTISANKKFCFACMQIQSKSA